MEKQPFFSGRLWPDWGNTTRAAMAGLGSIGLSVLTMHKCGVGRVVTCKGVLLKSMYLYCCVGPYGNYGKCVGIN